MTLPLHLLRVLVIGYVVGLFGLALFAAWSVLRAEVRAEICPQGGCAPRGMAALGDWAGAIGGGELALASGAFTGVMILGMALFALPWWAYLVWLKRTGRYPKP